MIKSLARIAPWVSGSVDVGRAAQTARDAILQHMHNTHDVIAGCDRKTLRTHTSQLRSFLSQQTAITHPKVLALGGAITIEAVKQVLGKTLYNTQLHAGVILCQGAVAQMQTGEGKTLAGLMPAVVHGLSGRGVHVATPNQYLADRDHQLMQPVIDHLGMTSGVLREESSTADRRLAYQADITYAPAYAFGFDFLRDQVSKRPDPDSQRLGQTLLESLRGRASSSAPMQRGLNCAILDEADHVLIDDAMSPLILSRADDNEAVDAALHRQARAIASGLRSGIDYELDTTSRTVTLTATGVEAVYRDEVSASDSRLQRAWHEYIVLALRANCLFTKDVHYLVADKQIRIVDASTGRIYQDRSWNNGLHQAIETKEDLMITQQRNALAQVTRQRFFRMYDHLSGMTGTATNCADELASVYGMQVVDVPLRTPSQRIVMPTRLCGDSEDRIAAMVDETRAFINEGRAVLIGTASISASRNIAKAFDEAGLRYELLNGTQDADEAEIIAAAGSSRAVTIATNMAGRGTDITLDDNVRNAGGLHVIVSQCNALQRVDRQLIGRAARGGDPGSTRVFVSPDDSIVKNDAPWIGRWIERSLASKTNDTSRLQTMIARVQRSNQRRQTNMRKQMFDKTGA